MSENKLTPKQDLATRNFYTRVLSDVDLFPEDPVNRIRTLAMCRRLLNYIIIDGKHVAPEVRQGMKLGHVQQVEDEWEADALKAQAAVYDIEEVKDEEVTDTDTGEADSSVEAESTEVREAVLPEDV